jgi:hypothetical protein
MALNLNPEADQLISIYMKREALPSKASAVNRLIILTLGKPQSAPQTPVQAAPVAPVAPVAPPSLGGFKL